MDLIRKTKSALKAVLSRESQLAVRKAANAAKAGVLLLGSAVSCPICSHTFISFLSFCARLNEWCPVCRSLGRHRLIYLYLHYQTKVFWGGAPVTILHVGAEYCLEWRLRAIPKSRYVSTDSMVSLVDLLEVTPAVCASVTELGFRSDSFDLVICSHVLEHVKHDRLAIAELFRVTKPGGLAIVPVPLDWSRAETDERDGLSAEDRARFYGEADHVRQYGRDYLERLREAGFQVDTYRLADLQIASRHRIDPGDPLIIAHKSAAKV
jgi:hypothetical protein